MDIKVSWSRVKEFIDAGFPFDKEDFSDGYFVYVNDGAIIRHSIIYDSDKTEYDSNYSGKEFSSQRYYDGTKAPIFSPSLDDVLGLYPKKKSYKNTVVAGQLNFFDTEVTQEKRICGGEYWISDANKIHNDDYVEFSIIDKNDVLGLFEQYNLEVGVDVLELVKFVLTDYIKKGNPDSGYHSQLFEGIKGTNQVIEGLFFRVACDSNGADNFDLIWRLYYYE